MRASVTSVAQLRKSRAGLYHSSFYVSPGAYSDRMGRPFEAIGEDDSAFYAKFAGQAVEGDTDQAITRNRLVKAVLLDQSK